MLYEILQQIPDKRRSQGKMYEQWVIIFIAILAMIAGSISYRDIAIYTRVHLEVFKQFFKLNWKKTPGYTTIRNIILGINTGSLEKGFRKHVRFLHISEKHEQVSTDGKTVRRSFDKFKKKEALQVLSAIFIKDMIIAGHKFFKKDKTNEIPNLRKLIKELKLEDKIITADALHCQKATIEQAKSQNCDYVVQVKDNQKNLLKACQSICNSYRPFDTYRQRDLGHGRCENRYMSNYVNKVILDRHLPTAWRLSIQSVLQVKRHIQHYEPKGKNSHTTNEDSFYISTNTAGAKILGTVARNHWYIENGLNYVKDVSMQEDLSRIRVKPENMVILRDWALNILRKNMKKAAFVKSTLYENSLNIQTVLGFDFLFP
jgi:predicted transposase YbfD/YdcC